MNCMLNEAPDNTILCTLVCAYNHKSSCEQRFASMEHEVLGMALRSSITTDVPEK